MRNGFRKLKQELERLEYFCTGTVLKRMMKCSKANLRVPQRLSRSCLRHHAKIGAI
jgi:hypothetical protein